MKTRVYEYYHDVEHTQLLARVRADSLKLADKTVWNRYKLLGEDLFLFVRQLPNKKG